MFSNLIWGTGGLLLGYMFAQTPMGAWVWSKLTSWTKWNVPKG